MKDLLGKAILDFQTGNAPENIMTETSISDADEMETSYLFRNFEQMPLIEKKALEMCYGHVLDVGCGAGSHSLHLLNERKLAVTPVDISANAIKACRLRGLAHALVADVLELDGRFDTILMLMNGTGIFGKFGKIPIYLGKLKSLLLPGGQILIDSSDIIYMFDQDDEGASLVAGNSYYGELTFTISYKGETENPFDWLYLDYNTLQSAAQASGLDCALICKGPHYDYLAKLSVPEL